MQIIHVKHYAAVNALRLCEMLLSHDLIRLHEWCPVKVSEIWAFVAQFC